MVCSLLGSYAPGEGCKGNISVDKPLTYNPIVGPRKQGGELQLLPDIYNVDLIFPLWARLPANFPHKYGDVGAANRQCNQSGTGSVKSKIIMDIQKTSP